ncbi:unnamed protein product, partial [Pylaiella littoralis]
MGEVPINPTGFAHGFRPLEGDHPPPTPTQRDINTPHFVLPGGSLSASSQQHTQTQSLAVYPDHAGAGLSSMRKRRRLPGPLAFLQHGGSVGLGQQPESGGASDDDNTQRRSDEESDPDEGEAGGGHFRKGPWLSLCSAVDAPIAEEGASDAKAVQAFLRGAVSPMSEVLSGDFDLRVPVVMAVIDVYTKLSISDVVVELVDPSGRIKGHLHPGCLEEHGPSLGPGAALLLKEVSVFVSGPGTTRLLNVHPDCVLAVFPPDTPLPTSSRLGWLVACDPPFTSRSISDSGGDTRESSRITPPRSNTWTSKASGRRRPRPTTAPEDPGKQQSQQQNEQQNAPRSIFQASRISEPLRGNQRRGAQAQIGPLLQGEKQPREPTHTTPGSGSPRPDGEPLNTSPFCRTRDGRLLPSSPCPSTASGCPSPPGLFTQSQSHQRIPLGQHSNKCEGEEQEEQEEQEGEGEKEEDEDEEQEDEDEDEEEETGGGGGKLLPGDYIHSSVDGGEHDDSTAEGRYLDRRRRATTTVPAGGGRGRRRGEGHNPGSSLRRPEGARCSAAAVSGTETQQSAPEQTAAVLNGSFHSEDATAGCGGDCGSDNGKNGASAGQEKVAAKAAVAVALGGFRAESDAFPRSRGDSAAPGAARRRPSSSGDAANWPARCKVFGNATRADDEVAEAAGKRGARLGAGGVPSARAEDGNEVTRCKLPGVSSSMWADLEGFASSDGCSSDDERGHSSKLTCSPSREGSSVPPGQRQPPEQQLFGAERKEGGGGRGDSGGAGSLLPKAFCASPGCSTRNANPNDYDRGAKKSRGTHQGAAAVAAARDDDNDAAARSPRPTSNSTNAAFSRRCPSLNTADENASGNPGRVVAGGGATSGVEGGSATFSAVFDPDNDGALTSAAHGPG